MLESGGSLLFVSGQLFIDETFDFRYVFRVGRIVEKTFPERALYFDFPFFGKKRDDVSFVAAVSDELAFDEFFAFLPSFFGRVDYVEDQV